MSQISFHEAKRIFLEEISNYSKAAKSQENQLILPEININKGTIEIKFQLPSNVDSGLLLKMLAKSFNVNYTENINLDVLMAISDLHLTFKDTDIYLDNIENYGINSGCSYTTRKLQFKKKGDMTPSELETLIKVYKKGNLISLKETPEQKLYKLGIKIYTPEEALTWEHLAGYDPVKQQVKTNIVNSLIHPEIYDQVAKETRVHFKTNRPKAVLFEGPPGTGKTLTGRIIASQTKIPMIYLPVEAIMSKWYGESENRLAIAFDAANDLGDSVLFIDEIDSLAISRDGNMNESTRRVLGVLLRKLDGLEQTNNTIALLATNRKDDLDSALKRRIGSSIYFGLPITEEREAIFKLYAKHLKEEQIKILAQQSEQMSGSNIEELCAEAERTWATQLIETQNPFQLPPLEPYLKSLKLREKTKVPTTVGFQ